MYRITTPTGETHLTEKITYVRQHNSSVFLITDQKRAEGVNYHGVNYLFADGAQVHEVDGGDEFKAVWDELDAAYREGVASAYDS